MTTAVLTYFFTKMAVNIVVSSDTYPPALARIAKASGTTPCCFDTVTRGVPSRMEYLVTALLGLLR